MDIAQQEQIINDCLDFDLDDVLHNSEGKSFFSDRMNNSSVANNKNQNDSTLIKINDQNTKNSKIDRAFSPIGDVNGDHDQQESGGEDSPNLKDVLAKNITTTINYPDQSGDLNVFAMGESASGVFGPGQTFGQPYNDNSKNFMMKP